MFDVIIRGGTVIDGTGSKGRRADVGIVGERIGAIGDLTSAAARREIAASGCIVAPGFIDIHNHAHDEAEGGIANIPDADNMLRQGVTTLVGGNCGGGPMPMGPHLAKVSRMELRQNYACLTGVGSGYAAALRKHRAKRWSARTRRTFLRLLAEDLEAGAIGYSSGLAYTPYIDTQTVIDGAIVAARYGVFYASHMRGEGDGLLGAIEELIRICRTAGLPGEISHIKCYGKRNWGKAEAALALVERANRQGIDVTADQYPYTGCYTGLASGVLPEWAQRLWRESGSSGRLLRPDVAVELRRGIAQCLDLIGGAANVILCRRGSRFDGKRLSRVFRGPRDTAKLLRLAKGTAAIYMAMCERDVETFMAHPLVMTGSDAHLRRPGSGFGHPRNFGTFPRVIARYVRARKAIDLERAVARATSMPARRLGLRERGVLARGKIADVVVFDPGRIRDTATFRDGDSYPKGILYVIVAGGAAVDGGKTTARGFGRVIRRGEG